MVASHIPGNLVDSIVQLGEGQENVAYEVNGALIVRLSKEPDPSRRATRVDREASVLAAVGPIAPLPIPEVRFTAPEEGCLAYTKLPGVPLLDLPLSARSIHASSIGGIIGELLAAVHAIPAERMADLVEIDDQPLPGWQADAAESYRAVTDVVPPQQRQAVRDFLEARPPAAGYPRVFSHNDLGIEHVLVDPVTWSVTGVIDWGDAAIDDPAYDFGLLYRDLGPAAMEAALGRYNLKVHDPAALRERARFYARCGVLEDLAYGLHSGRRPYVEKSLEALDWLFPA